MEEHKYQYLHNLLQYQVIYDSQELATQLLSISMTNPAIYKPALQIACDVLLKLQKYDQIVQLLLSNKQVFISI